MVKNPLATAEAVGSIPGSGTSPGEADGNPLWYSCLENPMDGGTWAGGGHGESYSPLDYKRVRHVFATKQQQQQILTYFFS